jgi:hypothetical protein
MKAHYRTNKMTFEIVGDTPKAVFREVARIQEVFEAESACGLCNRTDLRFVVRTVDKYEFYELHCGCGARFSFGQNKEGGDLFPKRKDGTTFLPNRGWAKWDGNRGDDSGR